MISLLVMAKFVRMGYIYSQDLMTDHRTWLAFDDFA